MAQEQGIDGSKIKEFVGDDKKFKEYIDKKFDALDTDHTGVLTEKELGPVKNSLGSALGLPPLGSSKESDHIYDEVFGEFRNGATVSKETFGDVLKAVYLGLADGLERDPISIIQLDGRTLREYAESSKFEVDTVSVFTSLDSKSENRLKAIMLVDGLRSISVAHGMPPAGDPKMKPLLKEGLVSAEVNVDDYLDQYQFSEKLKKVVFSITGSLQNSPLEVAHSEKVHDGKGITELLKDKELLHQVMEDIWKKMPTDKKGRVSKDYLRVGIDEMAPAAGLPPVGAVEEMDSVLMTVFSKIDLDSGGTVNEEEFKKTMLEVLGSLMMQLEGKPIKTTSSKVLDKSSDDGGLI